MGSLRLAYNCRGDPLVKQKARTEFRPAEDTGRARAKARHRPIWRVSLWSQHRVVPAPSGRDERVRLLRPQLPVR
jgi:hypothetical protein